MPLSIVAIVIAGLALTVSGLSYRHTVARDSRLEARTVTVTCREVITSGAIPLLPYPGEPQASLTRDLIEVRAVNNGHRAVEIRGVHFLGSKGGMIVAMPMRGTGDHLPMHIADGQSVNVFFHKGKLDSEAIAHRQIVAQVVVSDAESNLYSAAYPT